MLHAHSRDIRKSILAKWYEHLSQFGSFVSSDSVSGSSPPSVFVGSYGYPKVFAGPMVPPVYGETELFDKPEKWGGKSLEDIVSFRLNLVRGVQKMSVDQTEGRFLENLQELAMSSKPADSELEFYRSPSHISLDGESAPFGPIGEIKSAKYTNPCKSNY